MYVWHIKIFLSKNFHVKSFQNKSELRDERNEQNISGIEMSALCSPSISLSLSLSLWALSYAPLGTRRSDDTKENGVKTLPNCCYCFCFVLLLFDICEQNVLPNRDGAGQREKERQIRQLCRWLFIFLLVFSLIPRHCRCCCCYRFPHAHFVFLFTTQPAFLSCDVCRVYLLECTCLSVCVCVCANNTRPVACKIQIKRQLQLVITNCQKEQHTIDGFLTLLCFWLFV